jgi:hypothetical protein
MEEPLDKDSKIEFESIKKHVSNYLKNRLEYFRLSAVEYSAEIARSVVFVIVISIAILLFWIFVNITAAIAIGEVYGKMTIGFLAVALFNLLLSLFIFIARKALIFRPVGNWIVKILTKSIEEDENR